MTPATTMADTLAKDGRVAVYGINFDFDSATLRPGIDRGAGAGRRPAARRSGAAHHHRRAYRRCRRRCLQRRAVRQARECGEGLAGGRGHRWRAAGGGRARAPARRWRPMATTWAARRTVGWNWPGAEPPGRGRGNAQALVAALRAWRLVRAIAGLGRGGRCRGWRRRHVAPGHLHDVQGPSAVQLQRGELAAPDRAGVQRMHALADEQAQRAPVPADDLEVAFARPGHLEYQGYRPGGWVPGSPLCSKAIRPRGLQ
jgi:hypothetical protein